jgi:hypothetical protein
MSTYFFSEPTSTIDGHCYTYVLVSPGHFGKSINSAIKLEKELREKLTAAEIAFTDEGIGNGVIELGKNTDFFDLEIIRVRLRIKLSHGADETVEALTKAGFRKGLPA